MSENRTAVIPRERYFRCSNPDCRHPLGYINTAGDIMGLPGVLWKARGGDVVVKCDICKTWVSVTREAGNE